MRTGAENNSNTLFHTLYSLLYYSNGYFNAGITFYKHIFCDKTHFIMLVINSQLYSVVDGHVKTGIYWIPSEKINKEQFSVRRGWNHNKNVRDEMK